MIIIPSNVMAAPSDPFFSNTVLLLKTVGVGGASNSAFRDDSANNFVPVRNGDVTQGSLSPYTDTVGDPVPVVGGSVYFDGSGDYLTIPDNAALQMGTGSFTWEFWHYPTTFSGYYVTLIDKGYTAAGALLFQSNGADKLVIYASGSPVITSSISINPGSWHHIALVRNGTTLTLYINGVSAGSATNSTDFNSTSQMVVGANSAGVATLGQYPTYGHLSGVRIVKGTAVYTAAFTPPTAPLTAISGTSLLTCQSPTTITDASTNAHTITRVGDVRAGSLSPFGYGSVYFDGNGDYLTVPHSSIFNMGTGAFTAEFWMNPTAAPSGFAVTMISSYNAANQGWEVQWRASPQAIRLGFGDNALIDRDFPSSSYLNRWTHIAVSREAGGNTRMFFNGVQQGATVNLSSSSLDSTSTTFNIGLLSTATGQHYTGFLSNVRVVKGTALYTSDFTPSTSPLNAVSGTSLLTAQDRGSIVDASSNALAVTRVGGAAPNAETPFAPRPSGRGWSAYFSGSTDITLTSNEILAPRTGDFTFEGWMYPTSYSATNGWGLIHTVINGGLYVGKIGSEFYVWRAGQGGLISTTTIPPLNTWTHVVAVRSGTTLSLYFNGTRVATGTTSHDFVAGVVSLAGGSGNQTIGHTSNIRLVKGVAVYDPTQTTLTVPTSPLTAVPGTSLLVFQDNRFRDNSPYNFTLTPTATPPQVSRLSPFPVANTVTTTLSSTGSVYLDGSGDYLTVPSNAAIQFGTGDFCVEFWWVGQPTGSYTQNIGTLVSGTEEGTWRIGTRFNNSNTIYFSRGNGSGFNEPQYSKNVNDGAWHHIACVRSSGIISMYVDGQKLTPSSGSENIAGTCSSSNQLFICYNGRDNAYSTGNMSNVRVVKGSPVYTSSFTPPTTPLTAITGTSLLTCQDSSTVTDASTNNFTVTRVGDARASEVSPFKRSVSLYGGSGYFDGTGDYLSTPSSSDFAFGTGDWTVEAWIYTTSLPQYSVIMGTRPNSASVSTSWALEFAADGSLFIYTDGFQAASAAGVITTNTWHHVAASRSGTTLRVFRNGTQVGSSTNSQNFTATTLSVGALNNGAEAFTGHIANLRIVKGTAVYTANFTPPTSPVTAINGTSLLLNFDNAGVYDAAATTSNLALTGTAKTTNAVVNNTATSINQAVKNDGSSTWVNPASELFALPGDFTIEFWYYSVGSHGDTVLYDHGPTNARLSIFTFANPSIGLLDSGTVVITGSTVLATSTWYHIALSRSGTSVRLFLNGVQQGATWTNSTSFPATRPRLGSYYNGTYSTHGYYSELRVTRAARYTSDFTPPAAELPVK